MTQLGRRRHTPSGSLHVQPLDSSMDLRGIGFAHSWKHDGEYDMLLTRYRTLHVDQIDSEGNVRMHADAESRIDVPRFNECAGHADAGTDCRP